MKLELIGSEEDIIQRPLGCDYCIFEKILTKEQRKLKVLDLPIPERHIHRETIEQICGQGYDETCPIKYAAMRSLYDDFTAAQFKAISIFIWDLGKQKQMPIDYEQGMIKWSRDKNSDFEKQESYAKRFRDIWNLGLRKNRQTLTTNFIYEVVIANPFLYNMTVEILKQLKKESEKRDAI